MALIPAWIARSQVLYGQAAMANGCRCNCGQQEETHDRRYKEISASPPTVPRVPPIMLICGRLWIKILLTTRFAVKMVNEISLVETK